jgi:hypothetical protein
VFKAVCSEDEDEFVVLSRVQWRVRCFYWYQQVRLVEESDIDSEMRKYWSLRMALLMTPTTSST